MFAHKTYLLIGTTEASEAIGLATGALEIANCQYSFHQGIDDKGKVQTEVFGGMIHITLPRIPTEDLILWGMKSRQCRDGIIVVLDDENYVVQQIVFKLAYCVGFQVTGKRKGSSYTSTRLSIQAREIIVGKGVDFKKNWTI